MGIDEYRDEDEEIVTIEQIDDVKKVDNSEFLILLLGSAMLAGITYLAYWSIGGL